MYRDASSTLSRLVMQPVSRAGPVRIVLATPKTCPERTQIGLKRRKRQAQSETVQFRPVTDMQAASDFDQSASPPVIADTAHCIAIGPSAESMPRPFAGVWLSEGGSTYLSNGREFVCLSVHDSQFSGWVGKIAISGIEASANGWVARQAIRHKKTGNLSHWVRISLAFEGDVVTKFFPADVPGSLLPYGHIEWYRRLSLNDC